MHHPLNRAVKDLRLGLGDTQQQFAQRLGLAISTVVRYELTRPPKGKALAQLQEVAREAGRQDLWECFRVALRREIGLDDTEREWTQAELREYLLAEFGWEPKREEVVPQGVKFVRYPTHSDIERGCKWLAENPGWKTRPRPLKPARKRPLKKRAILDRLR